MPFSLSDKKKIFWGDRPPSAAPVAVIAEKSPEEKEC